jgi:cell filamentation protein
LNYAAGVDPDCYPGTTILINKLNIIDEGVLTQSELLFFLERSQQRWPAGAFDETHYRAFHRHLFGDVYVWAGEYRKARIGKAGNWFCYPEYVDREMRRVFAELKDARHFKSYTVEQFARHAARFLSELNAIHPFREGNGRTQMAFFKEIAIEAGYAWYGQFLEPQRVMSAMIASFSGEEAPLQALIRDLVTSPP